MKKKINKILDTYYPFVVTKRRKNLINKIWDETSDEEKENLKEVYKKYFGEKENIRVLKDMRFMKHSHGFKYDEYCIFRFKNKTMKIRKTFVSNRDMKEFIAYLNPAEKKKILRDKYECYLKFKEFYKREVIKIENENDFNKFNNFVKKNKKFVKKPYNKAFGRGIELIDSAKYKSNKELFNRLLEEGDALVLEELIVQDIKMKVLHPSSVNTIRMIPFIKQDGTIVIHNPFIKIGQNNSFVDNGGAGGMLALIDPKTGIIKTDAYDEMLNRYKKHPNTEIKIKGFQIPRWDEAIKLAKQLAPLTPDLKYIGWDIALTKSGWVVVEGNGATQFIGQQLPDDTGKKKEFERLINYKITKK